MLSWAPIPLVRVAIIFCGGILLGVYQFGLIDLNVVLQWSVFSFVGFFGSLLLHGVWRKYATGIFAFILIFWSGYVLVHIRTESTRADHFIHQRDAILAYQGVVSDHIYERKKSFKTTIVVNAVKTSAGWQTATGKVNLYIGRGTFQHNLAWGSHVVVMGSPTILTGPANPHEFDFKRFLSFKNIYHQHFVSGASVLPTGNTDRGFLYYSSQARLYFSNIIKTYVWGEQEQAIALALVIGVTDGVDNELENAYAASGAMHVLAVSGLHIGILYWIILFFLKPLNKTTKGQWLVAGISLLILWSYSFITGLSPSVLRAVTMFSFVAIAKPLHARSNIFNTLAGSAIILLLFDPYLIMSVGFQLSYLAVLGIIWIQRPLFLLWEAPSLFMSKVWEITCISIVAQLTTFSLGLLYFHQFPTYFLFSNLFVIPLSFLVLVAGIALLVVSVLAPLAKAVGAVLWASVKLLNWGVFLVEDLPMSIINNIYVDVFQCWLIMGIVSGLIFLWMKCQVAWLYGVAVLAVLLTGARWLHQTEVLNESKFVVYNVKGASVVEFFDRGATHIVGDSSFLSDAERVRFHIRPNRLYSLVNQSTKTFTAKKSANAYLDVNGETVLFLRQPIRNEKIESTNTVVVSSVAVWNIPRLMEAWPTTFFILDGTCGEGQLSWLQNQKIDENRLHAVVVEGAFQRTIAHR